MANTYIKGASGGETTTPTGEEGLPLDDGFTSTWVAIKNLITRKLRETSGPTTLSMGAVADGQYLVRSGSTIIGGGVGGMAISSASVTTSNVTGVVGTLHNLDVSGVTANRDFNLPTPGAANQLCGVRLSVGDATYSLIVKRNGTEFARMHITDEILVFQATGTGAGDWVPIQNGLIAAKALMKRAAAQSIASGGSGSQVEFDTASVDVGNMCNITASNYSVTIRRANMYRVILNGGLLAGLDDTETAQVYLTVNGAAVDYGAEYSPTASKSLTPIMSKDYVFAVGDVLKMYIVHTEGANVSTDTTSYPIMSVTELG